MTAHFIPSHLLNIISNIFELSTFTINTIPLYTFRYNTVDQIFFDNNDSKLNKNKFCGTSNVNVFSTCS